MEFKEYKAEDFCDSVRDGTHDSPKKKEKGFKLLTSKHIKNDSLDFDNANYISEEDYNKANERSLVEINDILYSMIGTIGLIYRVVEKPNYAIKNMGLFKIKDELKSKWLYYYLKTPSMTSYVKSHLSGSTQQYITLDNLRKLPIKYPVDECNTKRIIKVLEILDKKIKLNNQVNNDLQNYIDYLFEEWFVNYNYDENEVNLIDSEIGKIPSEWKVVNFDEIMNFSNGYGFDTALMLDNEIENSYKIFKMGNIKTNGGIDKSKTKSWILKENCNGLDKFITKKGDILMCMTDMKASVSPLLGHTALIDRDDEFIVNQRVGIIRAKENIGYQFVYTLSNNNKFLERLRSKAHSGVQVNLSTKGICETKLVLPSEDLIDRFNNLVDPLYERILKNNDENDTLEQLRDSLLPKLMSGDINLDKMNI